MPPGSLPEHLRLRWRRTTVDGRVAFYALLTRGQRRARRDHPA